MTEIWYCNFSTFTKSEFNSCLKLLPVEMQEGILSYRLFNDQLARLAARLMVYKATGYNKALFFNWQLLPDKKPIIPHWKHFSISHSGDFVIVGINEEMPVGIDIEQIRLNKNVIALSDAFLAEERAIIIQSANPHDTFFSLWTKKEALLKGLGDGLVKDGLKQFDCRYEKVTAGDEVWYFKEIDIATNYKCHLASLAKGNSIAVTQLLPESLINCC